jgi:hypothetical protein
MYNSSRNVFENRRIEALTPVSTSMTAMTLTVYIRLDAIGDLSQNSAWMFHEGLHGFLSDTLGRTDPDIQRALFGIDGRPSDDITQYIKEHCFK